MASKQCLWLDCYEWSVTLAGSTLMALAMWLSQYAEARAHVGALLFSGRMVPASRVGHGDWAGTML
jgi:hypothetical protein